MYEGAASEEALKLYAFACKAARGEPIGLKFNPNHDEHGRFSEGDGGGSGEDNGTALGRSVSPKSASEKRLASIASEYKTYADFTNENLNTPGGRLWPNQANEANAMLESQGKEPQDYEVRTMKMKDVTPSQEGEDRLNDSSRSTAADLRAFDKRDEDTNWGDNVRPQDLNPIVVDRDGKIIDGNHRFAAHEINKEKDIVALVAVGKGTGKITNLRETYNALAGKSDASKSFAFRRLAIKSVKRTSATDYLEKLAEEFGIDIEELGIETEPPAWFLEAAFERLGETFALDYWEGINDTTLGNVETALANGIEGGLSMREIADDIMESGDEFSRSRAMNIARTEVGGALNSGHEDGIRQIGEETGLAATKVWTSVLGPTTRDTHADADGQEVPVDDPFIVGGEEAMFPGDPELDAGERCNCQCTIISGISADELGDSDAEPEQVDIEGEASYDAALKFNENHDEHGRFASADGGGSSGGDVTYTEHDASKIDPADLPWSGDMPVPADWRSLSSADHLSHVKVVSASDIVPSETAHASAVESLKEHIADKENDLPPIVVELNSEGKLDIVDGNTRYAAAVALGYDKIPVRIAS